MSTVFINYGIQNYGITELWNGWDGTERCQSWATMDIVVFMQTPSSGQMYLIPSCWEYQTLPAHSSVHQWLIPLGTVDCFVQVSTPFPGSNPQLTTGYWEDTKTQFPCFNLGQLQRSLSELLKLHRARCQLQSHCRSAAPSAQSCLPAFLTRVPPRTLLDKPSTSSSLFQSLSPENPI